MSESKEAILKEGIRKLDEVIFDFQERIGELKEVARGSDLTESASQTESRKDADLELLESLQIQLEFAQKEMAILKKINPNKVHDSVDFGAVVITNKRNLFVSTGIEEFQVGDTTYFGLSTKAPLYKNMAGSKVGDSISFNGIEYTINDLF